jgi:hypothetical protein
MTDPITQAFSTTDTPVTPPADPIASPVPLIQDDQTEQQVPIDTADPQVDDIVQQGLSLQSQLSTEPAVATDSPQEQATPPVANAKSPLDVLEEILSKEDGKKSAVPETPKISEEEMAALRQEQEAQQAAELEQQRLAMQSEVGSEEQQKRDQVRQEQSDLLKHNPQFHIPQLTHTTIQVPEEP